MLLYYQLGEALIFIRESVELTCKGTLQPVKNRRLLLPLQQDKRVNSRRNTGKQACRIVVPISSRAGVLTYCRHYILFI
jgi:hypothetical protein